MMPLTVNVAPSITRQPENQSVTEGMVATFVVTATGAPVPTYQWQRATGGSSAFANLNNGGPYSGVTTRTLTIVNTTTTMSGDRFRCVVSNSVGSATSNAATLTVNEMPQAYLTFGSFSSRAENNLRDDNPDHDDDALNNKCRDHSFEKGVLRDSPELEMPAVCERPENE
jgi:hypothetical protein